MGSTVPGMGADQLRRRARRWRGSLIGVSAVDVATGRWLGQDRRRGTVIGLATTPVNVGLGLLFQVPFLMVVPPLRAGLVIVASSAVRALEVSDRTRRPRRRMGRRSRRDAGRLDGAGYDAAVVARWRWVLVPMVVVVAGCLPQPPHPPCPERCHFFTGRVSGRLRRDVAECGHDLGGGGGRQALDGERADRLPATTYLASQAVPIFGLVELSGHDHGSARPFSASLPTNPNQSGWSSTPTRPAVGDGRGWAMVDGVAGVDGMFMTHRPPY